MVWTMAARKRCATLSSLRSAPTRWCTRFYFPGLKEMEIEGAEAVSVVRTLVWAAHRWAAGEDGLAAEGKAVVEGEDRRGKRSVWTGRKFSSRSPRKQEDTFLRCPRSRPSTRFMRRLKKNYAANTASVIRLREQ